MADTSASTDGGTQVQDTWPPPLRTLVVRHKVASLIALAVVVVFFAILIPEFLTAGKLKITDSTSCQAWSTAKPKQQAAYSRLYVRLHGALSHGATSTASIEAAVNYGCIQAYAFDEADTITVLQAIRREY